MLAIIALGNRVYHHRDHTDFNLQRLFVFWLRALKNSQVVLQLEQFFSAAADLQKLECGNAIFYEQLLRHVFYHNSTLLERKQLIEEHFAFCQRNSKPPFAVAFLCQLVIVLPAISLPVIPV